MIINRVLQTLDRSSVVLFSNGWLFISPYLVFYLLFQHLHLPVATLKTVFILLHVLNLVLLVNYLRRVSKTSTWADFILWIGLALIFLLPGAYLEFPSDPWEHFRRIYAWQASRFIDENLVSEKFSYFWGWTLVYAVKPFYRRTAMDIYGAFWELLLAYQFYRLALRLGFSRPWARIQSLATVLLFGVNVFSFYRYYALASTILAYIAYLAALIAVMDFLDGKKKQALLLPILALIMYFNHQQELILFAISTSALLLHKAYDSGKFWRTVVALLPLVIMGSWLLGAWVVRNPQVVPVPAWNPASPYISSLGTFRLWDLRLPYFEVIGVHGLFSLAFAIVFFKKYTRIAFLSLMPLCTLLFSPFVLAFAARLGEADYYVSWRPLYAFPLSYILVCGLKELIEFLTRKWNADTETRWVRVAVFSIVFLLSLVPLFPYRGRFWFLVNRPPAELTLQRVDETAQWLSDNYRGGISCLLVGDRATGTALAASLVMPPVTERLISLNAFELITTRPPFEDYLRTNQFCGFLVAIPGEVDPAPVSRVGQLSGHWDPQAVNKNLLPGGNIDEPLNSLVTAGWTRTSVPPFYWLYQSPQ